MSTRKDEKIMENIYLRRDGRYEGRLTDKSCHKLRYFYGRTAEEVKAKIKSFKENQSYSEVGLTVKNLFWEWLEASKFRLKESTVSNYIGKAETHILPAFGNIKADELTSEQLHKFISDKLKGGLSSNYVADIVILLKSVMKFAVNRYNIHNRIAEVVLPKRKRVEVNLLSKSQQTRLQKYLNANQNLTSLGIALSLFTGLRIGELCALKWSDIDLNRKTITVSKTIQRIRVTGGTKLIITEPKSNSSVREIPIPDCIIQMLKKFSANKDFYLLSSSPKPIEPRVMQYRFQKVLKKANLPSIHFHALRHMFATNCVEMGFDVKSLSEILGHSGVEITLNRYVHSSMERKQKFMKRLTFAA